MVNSIFEKSILGKNVVVCLQHRTVHDIYVVELSHTKELKE